MNTLPYDDDYEAQNKKLLERIEELTKQCDRHYAEAKKWRLAYQAVDLRTPSFVDILREEFLLNTQNYPTEYHELFAKKFNRAVKTFTESHDLIKK